MSSNEYRAALEHDARQALLLAQIPRADIGSGIPETPEQRFMRALRENGVIT